MERKLIESCLEGLPAGPLRYFQKIDSTNAEALRWLEDGAPDFSLVIAEEQTAGRGRKDRKWYTPPNCALAFSLILRSPLTSATREHPSAVFTRLTALGALAVSSALRDGFDLPVQIKWPNDLLVSRRKIAGVLAESTWSGEHLAAAVIGIGINVAPLSIQNQQEFDAPATCVEYEVNRIVSRPELLHQVLTSIFEWNKQIFNDTFLETWNERLLYREEWVHLIPEADGPTQPPLEAYIIGLEQDGALKIRLKDGRIKTVYSSNYRIAAGF